MRHFLSSDRPTLLAVLLLALAAPVLVAAGNESSENWPAFRGADSMSAAADDARLPTTWSTTENVVWKAEVPGLGWSSPVVWGNRIFVTTVISSGEEEEPKKGLYFGGNRLEPPENEHRWLVYAFDFETGAKLWEREVHKAAPEFPRHIKNSFASETPVVDGERVYAYFGNLGVFALTHAGEPVWEKRFEVVKTRFGWGTAASPLLFEDLLFLVNDNEDQSWLLALDKKTGKQQWRVEREEGSNWATPYVWENAQRTELITPGTDEVRSYDLEGQLLWSFTGMSSITIPQPYTAHGLLYVASGYIGDKVRPVWAVKPGAQGDITLAEGETESEYIAWYQPDAGPYNPTPLVLGDWYFTLLDRGLYTVHNAKTGEELYFTDDQKKNKEARRRIGRGSGAFTASPWTYNGLIFVLSEDGDTYVIDPAQDFEVIGTNALDEMAMATPAIAQGSLVIRTRNHLYRITNSDAQ